jgi:hypothetical protein
MNINQPKHQIFRNGNYFEVNYYECSQYECDMLIRADANPSTQQGLCAKCHLVFCRAMHFYDHVKNCKPDLHNDL